MKINNLMGDAIKQYNKQTKIQDKKSDRKTDGTDVVKQTEKTVRDDKVEISTNAKILLQLDEGADRAEKINKIKVAVNNGTYKPNIEETAKAILKEWLGE